MKNFLNIKDLSTKELRKILKDAKKRKKKRKNFNTMDPDKDLPLKGKLIIQMYEKQSSRTRLSFHIAIKQLGANTINVKATELHLGKGGESLSDTAKILSTYGDCFLLRTDSDKKILDFSKNLTIPIINLLSPSSHPCQVLSDIFTVEEIKKKQISKLNICWIGDCNNVLNSLIAASIKFNFKLNIGCPKNYSPPRFIMKWINENKNKINIYHDPYKAAKNADVVFSDKVFSLNDKGDKKKKIKDFENYRINSKLMKITRTNSIFLHCLPRGNEVSENVFLSKKSKVWQQAYNRVHVQKSILLYCFGKLG
ncbi:ornithine carbamoyltransferase [Candidatus Pelagibacter sp.]|nr:ornithine carbamoyltransferase [Candidatus Pelagibacter sp.]